MDWKLNTSFSATLKLNSSARIISSKKKGQVQCHIISKSYIHFLFQGRYCSRTQVEHLRKTKKINLSFQISITNYCRLNKYEQLSFKDLDIENLKLSKGSDIHMISSAKLYKHEYIAYWYSKTHSRRTIGTYFIAFRTIYIFYIILFFSLINWSLFIHEIETVIE